MKWIKTLWYDLLGQEDKLGERSKQEKEHYRLALAVVFAFLAIAGIPLTGGWSLLLLLVSARKLHLMWEDR